MRKNQTPIFIFDKQVRNRKKKSVRWLTRFGELSLQGVWIKIYARKEKILNEYAQIEYIYWEFI